MTDGLYESASKSAVGRGLTAYDAETRDAERSLIAVNAGKALSRIKLRKFKLGFAENVEKSRIVGFFNTFMSRMASSYVRQYGIFFFAFGFYGALMYLLTNFAVKSMPPLPLSNAIVSGILVLISIPMIAVKKTAAYVICQSRLANAVLFGLFGLRRESITAYGKGGKRFRFAFIYGTLAGLLTLAVPPLRMISVIALLFAGYTVVITPEAGLILAVLAIPFVSTAYLGALIIFVAVCYLLKVMRGKRVLSLDLNDWAVLLFGVVIILGGVFSFDPSSSFTYSVKMFFYLISYVITVNLIRSRKWLGRIRTALIVSCSAAAIAGLLQAAGRVSSHFLADGMDTEKNVSSLFSTERSLSYFLILGFFFILGEFLSNPKTIRKLFFLLLGAATAACLWIAGFDIALMAFLIALLVFFLIYSSRTIIVILAGVIIIPAIHFFPAGISSMWQRITEGVSRYIDSHIALWSSSASMAGDYLWSGGGLGGYRTLFLQYANESVSFATDSSNIYLQTVIDVGIFGLILFLAAVLLFTQHSFSLFAKYGGKRSVDTASGFAGLLAILIAGMCDYIWSDEKMFLAFWIVMGIAAASGNITVFSERRRERFELR